MADTNTTITAPAPGTTAPAAAATPAAGATAPGTAAAQPAAAAAQPTSFIADAKPGDAKPADVSVDDAKAFLTQKGVKAEDMAGLKDEQIRAKYEQEKAKEAKPADDGKKPVDSAEALKDLVLPEGITLDDAQRAELNTLLTDEKLSTAERGSKLLALHAQAVKDAANAPYDQWNQLQAKWQDEVKADPEMGGANLDATRATIAKVIDELGGGEAKKIRDAFNFTGAGNHPEIVRLVLRAGKLLTEGAHVAGKPAGLDGSQKSAAQLLYPNQA